MSKRSQEREKEKQPTESENCVFEKGLRKISCAEKNMVETWRSSPALERISMIGTNPSELKLMTTSLSPLRARRFGLLNKAHRAGQ
jgi:hypothetical protein